MLEHLTDGLTLKDSLHKRASGISFPSAVFSLSGSFRHSA